MRNVDRILRIIASVEREPNRYKRMAMMAVVRNLEADMNRLDHPGEREEAA